MARGSQNEDLVGTDYSRLSLGQASDRRPRLLPRLPNVIDHLLAEPQLRAPAALGAEPCLKAQGHVPERLLRKI